MRASSVVANGGTAGVWRLNCNSMSPSAPATSVFNTRAVIKHRPGRAYALQAPTVTFDGKVAASVGCPRVCDTHSAGAGSFFFREAKLTFTLEPAGGEAFLILPSMRISNSRSFDQRRATGASAFGKTIRDVSTRPSLRQLTSTLAR